MSMSTDPANTAGGIPDDQRVIREILGDNRACTDERVSSNGDAAHDCRVCTDRAPTLQMSGLVQGVPADLRARIRDVCEHARRAEKHVVFNDDTGVHRHVVLNLDVVTDDCAAIDIDILSDVGPSSDASAFHDVREMPDLRTITDLGARIDVCRLVREIGRTPGLTLWRSRHGDSAARDGPLTCIEHAQDAETFGTVADRRGSRRHAVEKLLAFGAQRLAAVDRYYFRGGLHSCGH